MADSDAIVWVADGLAADGLDYGNRLVERLTDQGLRVARRDLTAPDAAVAVPAARLHVLSGGSTSVNDHSGWMPRGLALTHSLVEAAERGEHSVVGVCLGSQMIAETLSPGRRVIRAAAQIEVGLTEVHWCKNRAGAESADQAEGENSGFVAPNSGFVVPTFHYEHIDRETLAESKAHVVADNDHSPVQGFRYGPAVWGFQFHPEFGPDDMRRIILHNGRTIEACHGTTQAALSSVDRLERSWTPSVFDRLFRPVLTP